MPKTTAKRQSNKAAKIYKQAIKKVVKSKSQTPKLSPQKRAENASLYLGENIKKPKIFVPIAIIILLILIFIFRGLFVVALVNGKPISRIQYEQILQAQAGKQVMNSLVTKTLLQEEASKRNISVSQAELDAQIHTISQQLATQGQTLDNALAAQGLSKSNFMDQLKLQLIVQKMLKDKIKVSDSEISDYISKNQSSLPTGVSDDQMKAQVKQQLQQQKLSQQAQLLIQQLQAKAHITYFINL